MSRPTQFVILCEDRQQEVFARYFLIACGFIPGRIKPKLALKGKGAGEQQVRQEYPKYVQTYRRYRREDRALVVIIDADTGSVEDHIKELDEELKKSGQKERQPNERIGIFIPKRNIETWIHYLQDKVVNEDDEYKKLANPSECKPVVEKLAKERSLALPENAPPSLRTACDELNRIL